MADAGATRRRAAVLGSPIAHSLSPALHLAAYASLGLDWRYEAIEVDEAGLPPFLASLDSTWVGLSLTMPLKECVLPLLDTVDDDARLISSVNTVIPHAGGWHGTNTDVYGIVQALRQAGVADASTEPDDVVRDAAAPPALRIAILGSGATARSAVAAAARLGAGEVTVCARRVDAAEEVAALAVRFGLAAQVRDLVPAAEVMAADVVISALPGDVAEPWAALAPLARGVLLDASYHPWPTPLAAAWQGSGVASGRDMLLWQAVEQVRLMTGLEPPVGAMSAALPA